MHRLGAEEVQGERQGHTTSSAATRRHQPQPPKRPRQTRKRTKQSTALRQGGTTTQHNTTHKHSLSLTQSRDTCCNVGKHQFYTSLLWFSVVHWCAVACHLFICIRIRLYFIILQGKLVLGHSHAAHQHHCLHDTKTSIKTLNHN